MLMAEEARAYNACEQALRNQAQELRNSGYHAQANVSLPVRTSLAQLIVQLESGVQVPSVLEFLSSIENTDIRGYLEDVLRQINYRPSPQAGIEHGFVAPLFVVAPLFAFASRQEPLPIGTPQFAPRYEQVSSAMPQFVARTHANLANNTSNQDQLVGAFDVNVHHCQGHSWSDPNYGTYMSSSFIL